jgi:hypothetical protein
MGQRLLSLLCTSSYQANVNMYTGSFQSNQEALRAKAKAKAKFVVSLPSKFVLGEYWSYEGGEHSFGKLRVRGVQIRCGWPQRSFESF